MPIFSSLKNLSDDEYKLALEEYKIISARLVTTEDVLHKWQSGYLITNGVLVTLMAQVFISKLDSLPKSVALLALACLASIVSRSWKNLTDSTIAYLKAFEARQIQCENQLHRKVPNLTKPGLDFTTFDFKKSTMWHIKDNSNGKSQISTYKLRMQLPYYIWISWIVIIGIIVIYLFYSQIGTYPSEHNSKKTTFTFSVETL